MVRPPIRVPNTLDDLNDNVCDDLMWQPLLKARVSPNNQAQDRSVIGFANGNVEVDMMMDVSAWGSEP